MSTQKLAEYAAGYGTVLFFEDQATINALIAKIRTYVSLSQKLRLVIELNSFGSLGSMFPVWSENSTGMLQFTVWTALALEGIGASLQHHGAYSEHTERVQLPSNIEKHCNNAIR